MDTKNKVGLGGGCHWCTEGVFLSLIGINEVQQGWISSEGENASFSEAILIQFNSEQITLKDLIEIHLHTHSSTANHSFRKKYRSAVYVYSEAQKIESEKIIIELQKKFKNKIITQVLFYRDFKLNKGELLNYLYSRVDNPFCENYIHPKLTLLLKKFANKVDTKKIKELRDVEL